MKQAKANSENMTCSKQITGGGFILNMNYRVQKAYTFAFQTRLARSSNGLSTIIEALLDKMIYLILYCLLKIKGIKPFFNTLHDMLKTNSDLTAPRSYFKESLDLLI